MALTEVVHQLPVASRLQHSLLGNEVDSRHADRPREEASGLRDDLHTAPHGEVLGQDSIDHPRHLLGSQPSSPRKPPPMSRRPISNTRRQSARAWVKARTVWQFEPTRKLDAGHVTRGETHGNVRVSKKGDIPKCQHG